MKHQIYSGWNLWTKRTWRSSSSLTWLIFERRWMSKIDLQILDTSYKLLESCSNQQSGTLESVRLDKTINKLENECYMRILFMWRNEINEDTNISCQIWCDIDASLCEYCKLEKSYFVSNVPLTSPFKLTEACPYLVHPIDCTSKVGKGKSRFETYSMHIRKCLPVQKPHHSHTKKENSLFPILKSNKMTSAESFSQYITIVPEPPCNLEKRGFECDLESLYCPLLSQFPKIWS